MNRFSKLAAALAVVPVLAITGSALADSPGQLEGGSIVYVVKNMTKGGSYAPATTASACDEVQYSIRLHNTSYGGFTNINVKVNLPSDSSTSNASTMVATTNLGGTTGTSGTATVNFASAQTLSYENGSATLYDGNGKVVKTLSDSLVTSGVDLGGLNGSTTEFVNFKAKVNCPTPPVTPPTTPPTTPPAPKPQPTSLPNTGAGDVLGIFGASSAFGAVGNYVFRRNRR